MKNNFTSLIKMAALTAGLLSLGSCSRSEYAMLPQGASYAGTSRVATPVHSVPAPAAVVTPAPAAEAAPVAKAVATAPVAKAPMAAKTVSTPAPATAKSLGTAALAAAPAAKLSIMQRVAMSKVTKMVQKATTPNKHVNTASTQALDSKLRTAILFTAIGLLLQIIGGVVGFGGGAGYAIAVIGGVLVIVGAVFFILWLVDKLS